MFDSKTDHLNWAYVIHQLVCDDFSTNVSRMDVSFPVLQLTKDGSFQGLIVAFDGFDLKQP